MKWSLLLVPVISTSLFVTIITAAPATISSEIYPKTIMSAMGDLYPKAIKVAPPILQEEIKVIPEAIESTPEPVIVAATVTPKASTPAPKASTPPRKATPQKTQPSRSSKTSTPPASTHTSTSSSLIGTAKQYIGVPYVYGGTTPSGFDCSGFTQYVFAKHGKSLPRVARDQAKSGTSVSFSHLKAGDLVFFSFAKNGVADHVGISVGNGEFINASSSKGVTIYTLGTYWKSVYLGARRV
ncbi:MAG TPA: NlpC/P60 family protein [Desulfosporosinus sp.]|nr:NlpC/P60 family protein [Desulfosporosinus sp.]